MTESDNTVPEPENESVGEPVEVPAENETKQKKSGSFFRESLVVVISALVLSVVVRTFIFQAFYVPSESMENTLMINDRIVVSKISTRMTGVNRGDVIVFHDPNHWLGDAYTDPYNSKFGHILQFIGIVPSNSGRDLVKRVIGVGGDRVECCDADGKIMLNSLTLNEPYIKPGSLTDQVHFSVIVPQGSVFVMGDNRANSEDSRFHLNVDNGMVPVEDIVGRVSAKVWPFERIGGIER